MKTCIRCGQVMDDYAALCPNCGMPQQNNFDPAMNNPYQTPAYMTKPKTPGKTLAALSLIFGSVATLFWLSVLFFLWMSFQMPSSIPDSPGNPQVFFLALTAVYSAFGSVFFFGFSVAGFVTGVTSLAKYRFKSWISIVGVILSSISAICCGYLILSSPVYNLI